MVHLTRPEGSVPEDFHLSRRGIASLFFGGYALAALSAEASPIHTPADGLIIEEVSIPSPDRGLPAYLARPAAPGRYGAVVVVSEVFGVHDYIKDLCRRLARLGYVAIAPAFFVRVEDKTGSGRRARARRRRRLQSASGRWPASAPWPRSRGAGWRGPARWRRRRPRTPVPNQCAAATARRPP